MDKFYVPVTIDTLIDILSSKNEIESELVKGMQYLESSIIDEIIESIDNIYEQFKIKRKQCGKIYLVNPIILEPACRCHRNVTINSLSQIISELSKGHTPYRRPIWYVLLQIFNGETTIRPLTGDIYNGIEPISYQWACNYHIIMNFIYRFGSNNVEIMELLNLARNQLNYIKDELVKICASYDEVILSILNNGSNKSEALLNNYILSVELLYDYLNQLNSLRDLSDVDKESLIIMFGTKDSNSYFYEDKLPIEITKKIITNLIKD